MCDRAMTVAMQAVRPGAWTVRGQECIGLDVGSVDADVSIRLLYQHYSGSKPTLDQHVAVVQEGAPTIRGRIAYIGKLQDREGTWVGLALKRAVGHCDGTDISSE